MPVASVGFNADIPAPTTGSPYNLEDEEEHIDEKQTILGRMWHINEHIDDRGLCFPGYVATQG